MTVLQSIEGKFYEVPEDQAASFEIPHDKVKELLSKMPAPQSGPAGGPAPQRMGPGGPGGMPGPSPTVIQIFPGGMQGPMTGQPAPSSPGADQQGDVEPYWGTFWRNVVNPYTGWWNNYRYWNNW